MKPDKNPTSPNHVQALIGLLRETNRAATKMSSALVLATDPALVLDSKDLDEIVGALTDLAHGASMLRAEMKRDEDRQPVARVKVTLRPVSDEGVAAGIEKMAVSMNSACRFDPLCEPLVEQARRLAQ